MLTQGNALRITWEEYRKRQIRAMVRKLSDYQRKRLLDVMRTQTPDQLIEFTVQELSR
jgi:hypothetical protein